MEMVPGFIDSFEKLDVILFHIEKYRNYYKRAG